MRNHFARFCQLVAIFSCNNYVILYTNMESNWNTSNEIIFSSASESLRLLGEEDVHWKSDVMEICSQFMDIVVQIIDVKIIR